jgi:hypothetical protein
LWGAAMLFNQKFWEVRAGVSEVQIYSIQPILDFDNLLASLDMRFELDGEDLAALRAMAGEAYKLARPKAMFNVLETKCRLDGVAIGLAELSGGFFSALFCCAAEKAAVYVATCGREADDWSGRFEDELERYWAEGIKKQLLKSVRASLAEHLRSSVFGGGDVSFISPGSLAQWGLEGQKTVFELLGNKTHEIGVTLTDSFLMLPTKSSSGIAFSAAEHFESCMLCPRQNCPGRRAAFGAQA